MLILRFGLVSIEARLTATEARRSRPIIGFAIFVALAGDALGELGTLFSAFDVSDCTMIVNTFCLGCESGVEFGVVSARRFAPRVVGASIGGNVMIRPSLRLNVRICPLLVIGDAVNGVDIIDLTTLTGVFISSAVGFVRVAVVCTIFGFNADEIVCNCGNGAAQDDNDPID